MSATTPGSTPPEIPGGTLRPLALRPSRRLARLHTALLLALALLAAASLVPHLRWQPLWLAPLFLFWALLWFSWRAHGRQRARHPTQLSFGAGTWWLDFPRGASEAGVVPAELTGEWLVWPRLLVLPFRLQASGRKVVLICLPDSASAEDLRRLRVWLRTRRWHRESADR